MDNRKDSEEEYRHETWPPREALDNSPLTSWAKDGERRSGFFRILDIIYSIRLAVALVVLIFLAGVYVRNLSVHYSPSETFKRQLLSSRFVITESAQKAPATGGLPNLIFKADMYNDTSGSQTALKRETVIFSLALYYEDDKVVGILLKGARFRLNDCKEITFASEDCMTVDVDTKTIHFPYWFYDYMKLFKFEK
ncbi:hypothetical protein HYR54_14910 [Candidatus Acetothermia bacterium]|nr:hypothetical protein [Candidatus Acetothermia bacterium]